MWIRSQDRLSLIPNPRCLVSMSNQEIKGNEKLDMKLKSIHAVHGEVYIEIGTYKTKQRALEVLDEIQFYVCKGRNDESDIYKMLENQKKLLRNIYDVYEMPKE